MECRFTPEEMERRRLASVEALKVRERAEFDAWYQEQCDKLYWSRGQCCAGCDHWASDMGKSGSCIAAGIMSGEDVMRSMGITFCSYRFKPGYPYTRAEQWCGKFRDDFDWSTLDADYLTRIGAIRYGNLRPKPQTRAQQAKEE